jgi:hypothetical protein
MNGKQGFGGATPMMLFPLKDTPLLAAGFFISGNTARYKVVRLVGIDLIPFWRDIYFCSLLKSAIP